MTTRRRCSDEIEARGILIFSDVQPRPDPLLRHLVVNYSPARIRSLGQTQRAGPSCGEGGVRSSSRDWEKSRQKKSVCKSSTACNKDALAGFSSVRMARDPRKRIVPVRVGCSTNLMVPSTDRFHYGGTEGRTVPMIR